MDLNSCCCFIYYQWNPTNSHYFNLTPTFLSSPKFPHKITLLAPKSLFWRQNHPIRVRALNDDGFVLEVVPHLIDFLSNLPADFCWTRRCSCKQIVVHKDSPRGVHFRRAGPRDNVYFKPEEVRACIVTCGGLCPGLNTVILWSW